MTQLTEKAESETPNRLVTLKLLVFLFFGALVNMYAFLPSHMLVLGFNLHDIRLITLISALISVIGPLIVGVILDRVAFKRPSAYGKWLRAFLFIFFILAGLAFGSLLLVPREVTHNEVSHDPSVTFSCNSHSAHVFIKKNKSQESCESLEGLKGDLKLFNCNYACKTSGDIKVIYDQLETNKVLPERIQDISSLASSENTESEYEINYDEILPDALPLIQAQTQKPMIAPPHICMMNATGQKNCLVFLDQNTLPLDNRVGAKFDDEKMEGFCIHPLESTSCLIPEMQVTWMNLLKLKENQTCTVTTDCEIRDPFNQSSLLRFIKHDNVEPAPLQFDLYLILRIIAELFPVIIHTLLNISIVIATRETSIGRGNVGHQWMFYPIGVLVFATVIGLFNHVILSDVEQHLVPMILFSVTMFICAIVVLFSGKLPLTPPDWFWYTKCGMMAIQMSALKRYKWVITAIAIVAFVIGILWHTIEPIHHIFSKDIIEYEIVGAEMWRSKTFVYVIGSLMSVPLIWNGEKIVDLFGHSNIFILAFVSFALRFAGLYFDCKTYVTSAYELLEPISFYLPWLALILFLRHLIPKKCLALGQALLVILFFSLGRAIGFFYGTSIIADEKDNIYIYKDENEFREAEENDFMTIHTFAASVALIAALLYFIIYHFILVPCYRVAINRLCDNNDSNLSPQRVFHDERSRKGYFRY